MNFVEFPIVLGTAARESQPRRFRCKHGHEIAQDTMISVSVYGHPSATALICPACVVQLLGELCATAEIAPAPPPVMAVVVAPPPTAGASTVVNPPIPMSEVLRRRREAQGITAPAAPAPATSAGGGEAGRPPDLAIAPRPAPYTAAWRCQSHDQLGDAPSEQFCPAARFVSVADGSPFYEAPGTTPLGNARTFLEKVEHG